ncbi:MAG: NUDIX domain-containing protein [Porticoccaceae bacterium]
MPSEIPQPKPASTVVLLRDTDSGLETLLLKRNKALMFAGGMWVFPGGAIDPDDIAQAGDDEELAARIAAAREAKEESGLQPRVEDMLEISHWTTPEAEPKRFSTWIYAAPVDGDTEVVIDGGEIHHFRWMLIKNAIRAHEQGDMGMFPPSYLTLRILSRYNSIAEVFAGEASRTPYRVLPVFHHEPATGELFALFPGDGGYETGDTSLTEPTHRIVFCGKRWTYIRDNVPEYFPSLDK